MFIFFIYLMFVSLIELLIPFLHLVNFYVPIVISMCLRFPIYLFNEHILCLWVSFSNAFLLILATVPSQVQCISITFYLVSGLRVPVSLYFSNFVMFLCFAKDQWVCLSIWVLSSLWMAAGNTDVFRAWIWLLVVCRHTSISGARNLGKGYTEFDTCSLSVSFLGFSPYTFQLLFFPPNSASG